MNRRLLLKPMYGKWIVSQHSNVGYAGLDLSFERDATAMKVWGRAKEWEDALVNSGDRVTIKRPLPYRAPEKSVREIINNIDRGRGLTVSEIIDRATIHLAREEEKSRSELLYDMLRAGSLNINPFFKVPPVQHNKTLLLKRKKS